MQKFLVTGISSGFGKYAHEHLGGWGISRKTSEREIKKIKRKGADVIIHCAANSSRCLDRQSFLSYLNDNVFLTKKMLSIPHRKFIFMSTVDLYPRDQSLHNENEKIYAGEVAGDYALSKRLSEIMIQKYAANYVILRATSLLGKYARSGNLLKMIRERNPVLTLSADSEINCVTHQDVLGLIRRLIRSNFQGVLNVSASRNIKFADAAKLIGYNARFGAYRYRVGSVDNRKASRLLPQFKKTSREIISEFILMDT